MNKQRTRYLLKGLILLFLYPLTLFSQPSEKWGDQGDGTYRNFILWTELSNPDVVRVNDDFYMITSTIHLSPSIPIYHSRDLVNWKMIGHVVSDITQFSPKYGFDRMEGIGNGAWAAALRYHNGKFWMFVIDPSEGLFMSTATKAEGPWTPLYCVSNQLKNHDDCCPLWDNDGKAYITCADFSNRKIRGGNYAIRLFGMTPEGRALLDTGRVIYEGHIAEATKMYQRNGYYYIMFTEQLGERLQRMMRSKNLDGPFETRTILEVRKNDPFKPITQGSLVELANQDWMYVGQSNFTTVWGWPTALLPVKWVNDWPLIGTDTNNDGIGEVAWQYPKPIAGQAISKPQATDEFHIPSLQPQWEFNFQPMPNAWTLTARKGYLRLYAFETLNKKPWAVRNVLLQRIVGHRGTINVEMETKQMQIGQCAGVCAYGKQYTRLVVEKTETGQYRLKRETDKDSTLYGETFDNLKKIYFRIEVSSTHANFAYSIDNKHFVPMGKPWTLSGWAWLGARFGLLTWNNTRETGFVDYNWFRYYYQ